MNAFFAFGFAYIQGRNLLLEECFWHADEHSSTTRYYVIDAGTGEVERYASTCQAYGDEEYGRLLTDGGFADIRKVPSLGGDLQCRQEGLFVITALRQEAA